MESGQAVPFITIDEKIQNSKAVYQFAIHQKAINILSSEKVRNKKIAVAAVAGPQRSGKSFLSNRLLKRMNGFAVGPTTMPCTKGLWIWGQPVQINEDTVLIIIDTEGLNSVQRDINADLKIFSLSILLSSVFIYNSLGHIDQKALQNMSCVLKITQSLKVNSTSNDDSEMSKYFPYFYWVLRDFSLDLKGQTESQYLENSLKPVSNDPKDPKNQIRAKIRKLFSQRKCQCFPRPVNEEQKLAHIQLMQYEDLRQVFKDKMKSFEHTFFSTLPVKMINGKAITGQIFLSLTLEYIQAMNNGKVPQIMTSLERVMTAQARKITESLLNNYRQAMSKLMSEENMPLDQIEIQTNHRNFMSIIKDKLEDKFKNWLDLGKTKQYKKQLLDTLEKQYKGRISHNNKLSELKCTKTLLSIFQQFTHPEFPNSESVTASLVTQKSKECSDKVKHYFQICKAPRKYTYFAQKFPSQIFRYFNILIAKIRAVYIEEINNLKIEVRQAKADIDGVKKIINLQESLVVDKQHEIEALNHNNDLLKRQLEKINKLKDFEKQTQNMNKNDLQKSLRSYKKQTLVLEGENQQLIQTINKLKSDLSDAKNQNTKLLKKNNSQLSPLTDSDDVPNDLMINITKLRDKLSSINEYYNNKISDEVIDEGVISQIQKIRKDKHLSIERMKQETRLKKEQARKQIDKIKESYERNIQLMNKHMDAIKTQNIELQKKINLIPGNEQRIKNYQLERKKFQESLRLKQNNLNILQKLNYQKDKELEDLKITMNQLYDKMAILNTEKANFESFKETFAFILRQSLNWVMKKNNKLKHSLKTLNQEDLTNIVKVFDQLNLKPF